MRDKTIFETKGLRDSTAGGLAAVGMVFSLIFLVVSILIKGKMIGPWPIYATIFAACIGLMVYLSRKNKVAIRILEDDERQLSISVKGMTDNTEFALGSFNYWYKVRFQLRGGPDVVKYVELKSTKGEVLRLMDRGLVGSEPMGWPKGEMEFRLSEKSYLTDKLPELIRCLVEYKKVR